jgi:hypothetical protein
MRLRSTRWNGLRFERARDFGYARAPVLTGATTYIVVVGILGLFLLPGGRPRRFVAIVDSQAGGRGCGPGAPWSR